MDLPSSVSWNDAKKRVRAPMLVGALVTSLVGIAPAAAMAAEPQHDVTVVVRTTPDGMTAAQNSVRHLGGRITSEMRTLETVVASVPASRVAALRQSPGVAAATEDASIRLQTVDGFDEGANAGSALKAAEAMGAPSFYRKGLTGRGIDVALLDSGVTPV